MPIHLDRIKWNKNYQIVFWYPEKYPNMYDLEKDAKLADFVRLKKCVNYLALISQRDEDEDGYAIWENGKCTKDGGLGHIKH